MAFTKTPQISTYQTVEFPFAKEMQPREYSTSKDIDYLNIFFTHKVNKLTQEHKLTATKRCGFSRLSNTVVPSGKNVTGMYVWDTNTTGTKYLVLGLNDGQIKLASYDGAGNFTTTATISTASSGLNTNSRIGFTSFLYDDGTIKLVACDGAALCTIDTAFTVVKCTDVDFPASVWPDPIYLDGYLCLAKVATGDIYNSNLNDPLSWTAGNFISTESSPDQVFQIFKIKNYIVAVGHRSIEFFYNAGIATGSPLQVNRTLTQNIGIFDWATRPIVYNDAIYLIGYNYGPVGGSGGLSIYQVSENGATDIAPQVLKSYLNYTDFTSRTTPVIGIYTFSDIGADILILAMGDATGNALYFGLNLANKTVTRLSQLPTNAIYLSARIHVGLVAPIHIVYADENGIVYIDDTATSDYAGSQTIPFHIVTDLEEFDSINRKTMNRLTLVGEKPTSTANVSVQWTDDDYQNYNTAITVDMNQELPSITRLGQFRRRALKISGNHSQPFTLDRIEVDINKGQT